MQNNTPPISELRELPQKLPTKIPCLKMLILFASKAIGNTNANSDWDFTVFYDEEQRQAYTKYNISAFFKLPMLIGEVFKNNHDYIDIV